MHKLTVTCSSTTHTESTEVFPLEHWLRERATVTRYTCIAHLVPFVDLTGCRAKFFTEVKGIGGTKTGLEYWSVG
jgi:hypothetical protein